MNKQEYSTIQEKQNPNSDLIKGSELKNQESRTLIYGYDLDRNTFHVYLKNGEIMTVMYDFDGEVTPVRVDGNFGFVPSKRVYPESCDYEFCMLLRARGVEIPYTTFNENRLNKFTSSGHDFWGEVYDENAE